MYYYNYLVQESPYAFHPVSVSEFFPALPLKRFHKEDKEEGERGGGTTHATGLAMIGK